MCGVPVLIVILFAFIASKVRETGQLRATTSGKDRAEGASVARFRGEWTVCNSYILANPFRRFKASTLLDHDFGRQRRNRVATQRADDCRAVR